MNDPVIDASAAVVTTEAGTPDVDPLGDARAALAEARTHLAATSAATRAALGPVIDALTALIPEP